jgi:hypothetical protein
MLSVKLAGLDVAPDDVIDLPQRLRNDGSKETGDSLEGALMAGVKRVELTMEEREDVLRALEECPAPLAELRATLLQEHGWRQREGLG